MSYGPSRENSGMNWARVTTLIESIWNWPSRVIIACTSRMVIGPVRSRHAEALCRQRHPPGLRARQPFPLHTLKANDRH